MCGGRGTRLGGDAEKPLVRVDGRAMVDRALDALAASRVEAAYAVVSPHVPATRERLVARSDAAARGSEPDALDLTVVDAPGDGYVADLRHALESGPEAPVLTVAADLPLLDGAAVDAVLDAHAASGAGSLSVLSPAERKRELGASADAATERGDSDGTAGDRELAPTGINVVGALDGDGDEATRVTRDARLAVNVNYPADRRLAARLLAGDASVSLPDGEVEWLGGREADRGGDAA
ncbi:GTP--adenosylcobinamide-phosphate guanylyltransferase [Halorubrum sp. GN11_10-6_MGM]|uniref:NTP transferase domain-containing protein n=1 Tax=Halorubrum sp. GN11_10-6_MGM TaxID=2518112 RepID=UPI0010F6C1B7|nr:NTP transferase domain-containing protein [Halorubrum sp. GN11_10-6_MGM]TKX75738.1 GTP--adenosylcobinamide-phosphate guanylyltransferase [Halorubrum sp. GN11_10-6_MGM]